MSSFFYWEVASEIKPCKYPKKKKSITKGDYGGDIVNENSNVKALAIKVAIMMLNTIHWVFKY